MDVEVSAPEQHIGDIRGGLAPQPTRISDTDWLRSSEIVVKLQCHPGHRKAMPQRSNR